VDDDLITEDELVEDFRFVFQLLDIDWLLDIDEVVGTLVETGGNVAWLARELNDQADRLAMMWLADVGGISGAGSRGTRRYVHALKTAAAVLVM
jgi:hypothetical protein